MYRVKVHALSLTILVMATNHHGSMEGFVTLTQRIEVQYQDLSWKISSDGELFAGPKLVRGSVKRKRSRRWRSTAFESTAESFIRIRVVSYKNQDSCIPP